MKPEFDLNEQYDRIAPLEPSPKWDDRLRSKLERPSRTKLIKRSVSLSAVVALLFLVNTVLVYAKIASAHHHRISVDNRTIATQLLITTSSSRY